MSGASSWPSTVSKSRIHNLTVWVCGKATPFKSVVAKKPHSIKRSDVDSGSSRTSTISSAWGTSSRNLLETYLTVVTNLEKYVFGLFLLHFLIFDGSKIAEILRCDCVILSQLPNFFALLLNLMWLSIHD
jgi:hypothetical protein